MNARLLPLRSVPELARRLRDPVSKQALAEAAPIVDAVRTGGEAALREFAERFGDVQPGAQLFHDRAELDQALARLPTHERALPSSVLMTAVTARVAGVRDVWVASPRPQALSLAAAAIAGADGVLAAGGAQAIAALAYGAGPIAPRDVIVGPGNRYVTAAKQLVSSAVTIDLLAGPSELTILADDTAEPGRVAADLLAQAEHDPDAVPVLVALDPSLPDRVEAELARQLRDLPTAETARAGLANGGVIVVASVDEGVAACDAVAPEHLQLDLREATAVAPRLAHYGALFVGAGAAEVLGDYGAGPNHVLPTGGGWRAQRAWRHTPVRRSGGSPKQILRSRAFRALAQDDSAEGRR